MRHQRTNNNLSKVQVPSEFSTILQVTLPQNRIIENLLEVDFSDMLRDLFSDFI